MTAAPPRRWPGPPPGTPPAWVLSVRRSLTLTRIGPGTNRVTGAPVPVGRPLPRGTTTEPSVMAAGPTGLWVLDFPRNRLFHLAMRPGGS